MRFAANVELMFTEAGDLPARIRAAGAAGFDLVELWRWNELDLAEIRAALDESGCRLACAVTDWTIAAGDPAQGDAFREGLRGAITAVRELGGLFVVATLGNEVAGIPHETQIAAIVAALADVADDADAAGIRILVEAVNGRVDHPGTLVTSTEEAVRIVERVARPEVRLLFDAYHAAAELEDLQKVWRRAQPVTEYVQIADFPGRGEPGSGAIDWARVRGMLVEPPYIGPIGLEFAPTGDTLDALAATREHWPAAREHWAAART